MAARRDAEVEKVIAAARHEAAFVGGCSNYAYPVGCPASRHHWRRDALLGEDGTRRLAHLALRRTVLRQVMALELETQSRPQLRERLHSPPAHALKLLANS